jgi:hypothetical protein
MRLLDRGFLPHMLSLALALTPADVDDEPDIPRWRKVLTTVKKKIPPFVVDFWLRTVDPDFSTPPKQGRDLYIYTFPLQMFLLLWILLGYSQMFDSELDAGGFTSNKLSGFMVRAAQRDLRGCPDGRDVARVTVLSM